MTLFSITVASLFVSFALAATFLCFDVNPLSRAVRASCTGRVETVWNALRVFCVALGLVSQYVPAAICATVVLLMACALVNLHLEILPFHSPVENMVRGGIYACVAWIALASIIVSAAVGPKADAGSPSDSVVVLQWVLIGAVPFAFFFGVRAVQARQDRLLRDLKWLRREWEASPGYRANERRERRRASIISGNLEAVIMFKAVTSTGMPTITKNSTCDRFFDLEFGANRIFINGLHAHLLTRTLLLQRRKSDIPFVSYLLKVIRFVSNFQHVIVFSFLRFKLLATLFCHAPIPPPPPHFSFGTLQLKELGSGAPCAPWGMPEFGMTLFSITVASLFVSFALAATFLCFDVNPLSRAVRASCTGRVETVWNALRVFCVALGLVSQYVPAAICATVVLLMACALVNLHLEILPFHSPVENMVRGGIYACVAWIALASIIVSAAVGPKADAGSPSDSVVVLQWVLIGAVPFAFFFGVRAVQARQDRLLRDLKWLRREWEASPGYRANERRERRRASIISGNLEAVIMFKAVTSTGMPTITKNSTCDRFFDLEFGANRIFINGLHAHLLTRTLLLQRRKSDIPFVSYLLKRGLQEFPECRELVLLNLLLMRVFVRARAVNETTAHERFLDTLSDGAMLDHEYVLYASQRIIGQRDAGSSMGQDDISALQLLEFEMKFNKIKKLHRSCILALKAFWQIFCTHKRVFRKKAKYSEHLVDKVDDIVSCLQRIERASEGASEGYKALLDKFPRSVPLLHSYGSFCDVILNRAIQARQLMNSALLLESGPEEDVSSYAGQGHTLMHTLAIGDEENRQADQTAVKSTSSSSDGNHRARIDRFIASWKDVIMAKELADLRRLNWRILFATLMILVVCTIGFVLMDSVLYESTAHANIDLVDGSQLFRVNLFQSLFLIHSLVLADISNNTVEAASIQSHLNIISQGFAAAHLQSFQKATADVGDLYKSQTWQLFSPTAAGWITSFHSLWFLGNEFSSQVASASGMPTSEAAMWNNDITNLSPAMRAIVFLNENCFQNILPAFEQ
eukprot:CAMPEP_0172209152 /NCGR_PEP_ID=MMETSP1050-20130122/34929_1 /TAXON_ID=233186 /ORGANISM="Cryptomonas curvata, Strain CCAP979/52" /LENGTH=1033 /DNA_ID=CAMNT_0012888943 /DNA_START=216 /DNA_END=3314 /DNA_ORIENTATION=+